MASDQSLRSLYQSLTGQPAPANWLPVPISIEDDGRRAVPPVAHSPWAAGIVPRVVPLPVPVSTADDGSASPYANWQGAPYTYGPAQPAGPTEAEIAAHEAGQFGAVAPVTVADITTALAPVAPAPAATVTSAPAPAPVPAAAPAPATPESYAPGARASLCDLGLCGNTGRWAAGDGTTMWDRRGDAMMAQMFGGIDAITQNDAANRRLAVADMRATPEWAALFNAARINTQGDTAAAAAVADRELMAGEDATALGYLENLAAGNEQAVNAFRSKLLGTASQLNRPDAAAPAFAATPGFGTGGVDAFYADPVTGQPVVEVFGRPYALPNEMQSYAFPVETERTGVAGQQARRDAGQEAMQRLIQYDTKLRDPVPFREALLKIAQEAQRNPTGANGPISPMTRKIIETRVEQLAKDPSTANWTVDQILTAATTGAVPALPAPAAQ